MTVNTLKNQLGNLYPFESHFLELPEKRNSPIQLHYVDEGQGEPIVMVHGNPTWSFYFRRVLDTFRKTHRVVAPDHIGSGFSSKPANYSYRLEDHIENLTKLLKNLNLSDITLIVHDWGGPIGLGWATRHPHLVKRLIILNTAAFYSSDVPWRIRLCRIPILGDFLVRRLNLFAGLAPWLATTRGMTPPIRKAYGLPSNSYDNRVGISGFLRDIPVSSSHPSYGTLQKIESRLSMLRCPKLILWGDRDFCFHSGFRRRWQEIFPDAEVKALDYAGHLVLEDAPDECLNAIADFLRRT
jgi:haloalkane dehalogenase